MRFQTDGSRWCDVRQKGSRWSCSCADHLHRKAQCKHILAVMAKVAEREMAVLGGFPTRPDSPSRPTSTFTRWTAATRNAARGADSPAR